MLKPDWKEIERYYAASYCLFSKVRRCGYCGGCRELASEMENAVLGPGSNGYARWASSTSPSN